jgi:hypothetical protein
VLLSNHRLSIDAAVLAAGGGSVVVAEEAARFYSRFEQTAAARLQALLLPTWLSAVRLTASQLDAVVAVMGSCGSWDALRLNGGATIYGDFVAVDGLRDEDGGPLDRRRISRLECSHSRSRLVASGWAVLGWEPKTTITAYRRAAGAGASGLQAGVDWLFGQVIAAGVALIARLGPVFHCVLRQCRGLNVAHDLGQPCSICVRGAGQAAAWSTALPVEAAVCRVRISAHYPSFYADPDTICAARFLKVRWGGII